MNECDVCGPHDGKDYTGTTKSRYFTCTYHLCKAHYLAS